MIKLTMPIIVEGKYDKITLENVVDTLIISTDGFRIFKNKEMCQLISALAKTKGIIVMTDSDGAGQVIRNHIKNIAADGKVINVYVPQLRGKEKRKAAPSKEGYLGVEGISKEVLKETLTKFGITQENAASSGNKLTKTDLYSLSLSGCAYSAKNRQRIISALGLPKTLSSNAFLDVVNTLYTPEEFTVFVRETLNL